MEFGTQLDGVSHSVQQLGSAWSLSKAADDVQRKLTALRKFLKDNEHGSFKELLENIRRVDNQPSDPQNQFHEFLAILTSRSKRARDNTAKRRNHLDTSALCDLFGSLRHFANALHDFEEYTSSECEDALEKLVIEINVIAVSSLMDSPPICLLRQQFISDSLDFFGTSPIHI